MCTGFIVYCEAESTLCHKIRLYLWSLGQKNPQWINEAILWQFCHHQWGMRGVTQSTRHGHCNLTQWNLIPQTYSLTCETYISPIFMIFKFPCPKNGKNWSVNLVQKDQAFRLQGWAKSARANSTIVLLNLQMKGGNGK